MYCIRFIDKMSNLNGEWNGYFWKISETEDLIHFRPEGSNHRPRTRFRLVYSCKGISGIYYVEDRYVKCVHQGYLAPVYKDSCVEFFVKPECAEGYFNFEFNCGGSILSSYITDHSRTSDGFKESVPLAEADLQLVKIFHSLPETISEEIEGPVNWVLEFFIPFAVLEKYAGNLGYLPGQIWRANFQKCGDATSHPHWGSWQPLPELNFHLPDCFGYICFEKNGSDF